VLVRAPLIAVLKRIGLGLPDGCLHAFGGAN